MHEDLRRLVEREARDAHAALPLLRDAEVGEALHGAARLLRQRIDAVLTANGEDVAAAELDEGALDRLRLDDGRVEGIAAQLETMAALPPLEREGEAWTL